MKETSSRKYFRILFWGFLLVASVILLYLLSEVLIILTISILIALIFVPFIRALEKGGISRMLSTLIVFIASAILLYLALSFFIPRFLFQMNQLIASLEGYSLHNDLVKIESAIYTYLPFFTPGELSKKVESMISSQLFGLVDQISPILNSIFSIVALLVIVPFITFFLLKDSKLIMKGLLKPIPNKYFEMSYQVLKKISNQLGRYVRAWIFDASFVGITCGFGFYLIGIENALPLGVIAGTGHLVPYLGPLIGGVPALVISIIQFGDLSQAPFIIILVAVVYTLDNGFVQPYVFSKGVDMHPIIIILLIIAGSQLYGILGMLLAVPTATVIKTAASETYVAYKNYKSARA
ncbi:MAG: AI-2E family transporter [Ignavibacteriaceae bacterium]|nr:AI-2E family transporter [Ignavibacteriaceae bacterium]